ncbi:MAG: uroporphyrinogen-III C-methyltransferase [Pseudomonadota bacterium]
MSENEAPNAETSESEAVADSLAEPAPKAARKRSRLPLVLGAAVGIVVALAWAWNQYSSKAPSPEADRSVVQATPEPESESISTPAQSAARAAETVQTQSAPSSVAPDLIPAATKADIDALRREITSLRETLADVNAELDDRRTESSEQARAVARLRSEQQERIDLLDSLPGRVRNTEEALARLQGISSGSQRSWLLAETEYYMQLANAQLQLANNPELASEALKLADQRVRELADPTFTPVRRALAEEIASLATLSTGDIEGASLTLGSLMSMVDTLPIDQDVRSAANEDTSEPTVDDAEDAAGWDRMRGKVGDALGSFVRVRKSNTPLEPLLPPEAESLLRLNLKLELQSARSALLLGENTAFRQNLADIRDWITQYFDVSDDAVQSMLGMLDDVDDARRSSARPDISGSLTLLRELLEVGAASE